MSRPMKDSGVEWIGDIPEHYSVVQTKYISQIRRGASPRPIENFMSDNGEGNNWIRIGDSIPGNKYITSTKLKVTEEGAKKSVKVNPGDLIMSNSMSIGRSYICGISGYIHDGWLAFSFKDDKIDGEWLSYALNASISSLEQLALGTTVSNLNIDRVKSLKIPIYDKITQQKIINILDEKCEQVDFIISDTKKSIIEFKKYKQALITETVTKGLNPDVKMKDSGIEWIGEIPEHCNLKKLKLVSSKIGSGKTPRGGASVYSDTGILFLRSQNIYDTGLYLNESTYISEEIDEDMRSTRVYTNDVLLNITGASIGRCCVYPENMERHANVNQHVCIIRPISNKMAPRFLSYFFNSNSGQSAIRYYQTGGNREGLNFEQIGNIRIPYYSIEEQQQIADYLDEKCAHIDSLIADKEKLVGEFETYKKALIFEYVTGKKEVE